MEITILKYVKEFDLIYDQQKNKLPSRCKQEWKKCKTLFFDGFAESINASPPSWYKDSTIYWANNQGRMQGAATAANATP